MGNFRPDPKVHDDRAGVPYEQGSWQSPYYLFINEPYDFIWNIAYIIIIVE